ncbi:MAG: NAD-dependent epimerase/dehydratase family protein [Candidatus Eremiobacterota bacterium]
MSGTNIHAVTGAYGYSGKYIAGLLLDEGYEVRTLTDSQNRSNPFGDKVKSWPYHFDNFNKMVESLKNVSVLYNTYWVRFNYTDFKHSAAVDNTLKLFKAAREAGVKKIVHISITNPSEISHLEYFSGKAKLEKALINSGMSYSILRPAVIFGPEDILINNIAWMLRKFPLFAVFGNGLYRLQPIYVKDLADLAVREGKNSENSIINATGPETFTYRELVKELGRIIGKSRPVISLPPVLIYIIGYIMGKIMGDVVITWDEVEGLMEDLLYVDCLPAGKTKLTDWAKENASTLGIKYANELARRKNRLLAYDRL